MVRFNRSMLAVLPVLSSLIAGCATEVLEETGDELTSVTARSRDLEFQGQVFVATTATDDEILRTVRKQTQSAFGALRTAEIGVSSRELKGVDPSTFKKSPVTVVDVNSPGSVPAKMLRVTYTYKDSAVVPVSMATQSAFPSAVLNPAYASQSTRILKECTSNDEHARDFQSSIWYVFDPSETNCRPAMAKEAELIAADQKRVKFGEIAKSEVDRLYIPTTMKLGADRTNKGNSYPEYDRLFSGGVEKGKLIIGMVSGFIGHDVPLDESDYGYSEWIEQITSSMKSLKGWKVVSTEPAGDPLRYSIGGKTVTFSSFEELAPLFSYNAPSTVQGVSVDLLKKEIGKSTIKKWITFETSVNVAVGSQAPKPVAVQIKTYFGVGSEIAIHKRMIKSSDVYIYNGHSSIGYGPLDPSNFQKGDFPSSYQIMFVDGCVSYNYYNKDYVPLKEGGTKNLDLITNGLEAPAGNSGIAIGALVSLLLKGKAPYSELLQVAHYTDELRVVDGELDNQYSPTKSPLRVTQ